jgi:glutamyl-tRNA synthetase
MNKEVRVRFAPSPTGALHIGGVRTALYNYLFAKKNKGTFVLRIEDTDQTRYVEGTEEYIQNALDWLGIAPDEGIVQGGNFGPYKQSERKELYLKEAQRLIDEDKAYYAFDTPEELDAMRERLKAAKVANPVYDSITRSSMKNSLTLSLDEVQSRINAGGPYVIRLKVPRAEEVRLNDMVRGWVKVHSSNIDDKILVKSDGMPTYHLANVVDDHMMEISHVIRGEEWLPSAPLHVLLYQFLGWEDTMPQFAHLPLLLKPDGNGKLSKRDADKKGYPVFPMDWADPVSGEISIGFKEQGYFKESVINFLALLGWNPGTEQEIFDTEELIQAFSIDRINKAGAKFDIDKAKWFNQQYMKAKPLSELAEYLLKDLKEAGIECTPGKAETICALLQERVTFPSEFMTKGMYFFAKPVEYDEKVIRKKWNDEAKSVLQAFANAVKNVDILTPEEALNTLNKVLEEQGVKMGKILQALRVSVTGTGAGPDLMGILSVLGRDEVVDRIETALEKLE